jgi:hypothetical protein
MIRHIPKNPSITAATKPRKIVECLHIRYGETIAYKLPLRAKPSILEETINGQQVGFRPLPAYVAAVRAANPEASRCVDSDARSRSFH